MLSILHIDNSLFYKKIVSNLITEKDFQYISVQTPKEAFEILQKQKIDLIITGLEFGEDTGEDFIKTLNQSNYNHIPIIVLSSRDDGITRNALFNLGVIDFINKVEFIEKLQSYIDKFHLDDLLNEQLKEIKIAVLDDEPLTLRIIQKIFKLNNITNVDYFTHPNDLLNQKEGYSIYLIDFILPSKSGKEVILDLRQKYKYALIFAMSVLDNQKIISNILCSGADDYILKPFNEKIFMARLKANIRSFLLMQELKETNLLLENLVKTDGLTNIYNHKYIYERLEKEVFKAKQHNTNLSIIMFDIDKFKNINDTYGHPMGDEVLIQISSKLKKEVRETDIVGRYGGEEFIIILPETDLQDACSLADRLRVCISKIKFTQENLKVTISGGVSTLKKENPLEFIRNVDILLYKAKNKGRNRIEYTKPR